MVPAATGCGRARAAQDMAASTLQGSGGLLPCLHVRGWGCGFLLCCRTPLTCWNADASAGRAYQYRDPNSEETEEWHVHNFQHVAIWCPTDSASEPSALKPPPSQWQWSSKHPGRFPRTTMSRKQLGASTCTPPTITIGVSDSWCSQVKSPLRGAFTRPSWFKQNLMRLNVKLICLFNCNIRYTCVSHVGCSYALHPVLLFFTCNVSLKFTAFQREWHICVCQQSSFSVSLQTRWRKLSHNVFCISSGILYDCRKRFFSKLNPQSKFCSDILVPYMGGSPQLWPKFEVVLWNTLGAQWVG